MVRQLHEMSDDEISKLSSAEIAELTAAEVDTDDNEGEDEGDASGKDTEADNGTDKAAEEAERLAAEEAAATAAKVNEVDEQNDGDTYPVVDKKVVDAKADDKNEPAAKADAKVDEPADKKADAAVNFEAEYKALLAPFKANGRDIQVADVSEARQLMQMGANYNKKMQAMKPHLSTLRMLENAQIGEAELSYLIDLHRKDAGAINKLVKESGIDPLDLSTEKAADYKPGNHKPSDAEVELEAVLADLDGTEGLPKTIDIVTTKWDAKSKDFVARNPQLLKIVNHHVESGVYDLVAAEVDRKRTFGQLSGLSDFDAYRQVADQMNEDGKFAHLEGSSQKGQQAPAAKVIEAPNPKKADDDKRKEQKRGAAPAKAATPAAKNPDFNPLAMSDAEFAKLTIKT